LEEQKVAQSLLAGRANEEIDVGDIARIQPPSNAFPSAVWDFVGGNFFYGAHKLIAAAIVDRNRQKKSAVGTL
jgi:hypothetical protein